MKAVNESFCAEPESYGRLKSHCYFYGTTLGKQQRNLYIKQFDDAFHLLAKTPMAGKTCDYIKQSYRKFPQGSHLIFYKDSDSGQIEIVRILHKNVDTEAKF
ncbi:type II toxin-antitoxin system RelE/ParE family toxin [Rheinheimera faecalis]